MRKPSPALLISIVALFLALGGAGIAATGGGFLLGKSNTADATSYLSAPVAGSALNVSNTSTTAGSTALKLNVASGHAPLAVNSATKVPFLNADQVDGKSATDFLGAAGTAANSSKLGGYSAQTFYRLRTGTQRNTTSTLDSAGGADQQTSATVGSDGFPLISYVDANGSLKVAHCQNAACSSSTKATLDTGASDLGGVASFTDTSITIGSDGLGLISYNSVTTGNLKVAHCSNVACSSATLASLDSSYGGRRHSSITIGADGLGLISFQGSVNASHVLEVIHCSNAVCSTDQEYLLDSTGDVGYDTSITTTPQGVGLISYYDLTNGDLKVAHCSNVVCSSANVFVLDSTGDVGLHTSITIGADGLGLISYQDHTSNTLKVAHCEWLDCSSASTRVVDTIPPVENENSVTIGADGLGLISYYDSSHGDLRIAHCTDFTCGGGRTWTLTGISDVGRSSSVTTGTDGLPLISYLDSTNHELKVTHCGSPFCTPYFRRR
jgi:hypothetical protein